MEAVLTVIALLFVLCAVLGAYATVKAIGAARRGVDRTITQARRTVEDTTLRARTLTQPGPAGELAKLRLNLRTSMRVTRQALRAGVTGDESLKEALGLFERLSEHGHELDTELRRLETEPDRHTLATRLPELRERTERITQSADSLRWAVHDRARRFADDDLEALSAQIAVEAGALRHWTAEGPTPAASAWPEAPAAEEATDSGRTPPHTSGPRTPQQPGRLAIDSRTQRSVPPWQRKHRHESTS